MQPRIAGQLGMERRRQQVTLAYSYYVPVLTSQYLTRVSYALDAWGADEHAREGRVETGDVQIRLKRIRLPPVRVPAHHGIHESERLLVRAAVGDLDRHEDRTGASAPHRHALAVPRADRLIESVGHHELGDSSGLSARDDQAREPLELARKTYRYGRGAKRFEVQHVLAKRALQGEDADPHAYQPRSCMRSESGMSEMLMPTMASPRFRETLAIMSGSLKCVVASTMAFARFDGSPLLKMPLPTNTPSQPSCIMSAASAGVAMPPAEKLTTGSVLLSCTHFTRSYGACRSLAAVNS